jgi:hypothetical protein
MPGSVDADCLGVVVHMAQMVTNDRTEVASAANAEHRHRQLALGKRLIGFDVIERGPVVLDPGAQGARLGAGRTAKAECSKHGRHRTHGICLLPEVVHVKGMTQAR